MYYCLMKLSNNFMIKKIHETVQFLNFKIPNSFVFLS